MSKPILTQDQGRALRYMALYANEHNRAPTINEISHALTLPYHTVSEIIAALIQHKCIVRHVTGGIVNIQIVDITPLVAMDRQFTEHEQAIILHMLMRGVRPADVATIAQVTVEHIADVIRHATPSTKNAGRMRGTG